VRSFLELVGTVGAVVATATGVIILIEKLTGLVGRWLRRNVSEATRDLEHHTKYHLGPNGTTTPIWVRLRQLEEDIAELRKQNT
jgi:hypothetical protein